MRQRDVKNGESTPGGSTAVVSLLSVRERIMPIFTHLFLLSPLGQVSHGETRSELLIQNTSAGDNGTYHCQAENKAARSVSNFTLHVTMHVDPPKILKVCLA